MSNCKKIDSLSHHPTDYFQQYEDVFTAYEGDDGRSEVTWGYGRSDRYRITKDETKIGLEYIYFNNTYEPLYKPVLKVVKPGETEQLFQIESFGTPREAVLTPELVLRGLLNVIQLNVQSRVLQGFIK